MASDEALRRPPPSTGVERAEQATEARPVLLVAHQPQRRRRAPATQLTYVSRLPLVKRAIRRILARRALGLLQDPLAGIVRAQA